MDILTQAVLGATVAVVVTKAKSPRKAIVVGGLMAIFPDLDLLIPYDNPVDLMVNHRTWSHSWVVHAFVTPFIAYILTRIEPLWNFKTACLMAFFVLATHSGLDALTVFGTDIFWPFSNATIVGGSVFIIDPVYTLPLLIFSIHALLKPKATHLWRNSLIVLAVSSAYLSWGGVAKTLVEDRAISTLSRLNVSTENILVHTTPFNTLLWRIIVIDGDSYYEGFHSILDNDHVIDFQKSPRNLDLLDPIENNTSLQKLRYFNHGFYSVSKNIDNSSIDIVINDLRKSSENIHTFRFLIGKSQGSEIRSVTPEMLDRPAIPEGFYKKLLLRILTKT